MGCGGGCGGNGTSRFKTYIEPEAFPGEDTFVRLKYVGDEPVMIFKGVITGTNYLFGTSRTVGLADVWDAPAMINTGEFVKETIEW